MFGRLGIVFILLFLFSSTVGCASGPFASAPATVVDNPPSAQPAVRLDLLTDVLDQPSHSLDEIEQEIKKFQREYDYWRAQTSTFPHRDEFLLRSLSVLKKLNETKQYVLRLQGLSPSMQRSAVRIVIAEDGGLPLLSREDAVALINSANP